MQHLILFPCQLYDAVGLKKKGVQQVFLLEDPLFYGRRGGGVRRDGGLQLNQLRLAYMHVCHRRWMENVKKQGMLVQRGTMEDLQRGGLAKTADWKWIDPCDLKMEKKMRLAGFGDPLDSPSFLLTRSQLEGYKPNVARLQHGDFYNTVKQLRADIPILKRLLNTPNLDRENRRGYHRGMPSPPNAFRKQYGEPLEWQEAITEVVRVYPRNPKPLIPWETLIKDYLVYLPVENTHAREWMHDFLKERFKNYGEYQDVVLFKNPLAFHSGLSIYLNNGLLTPEEVLRALNGRGVSMATLEGFVRQIAGWREYSRLYYHRIPEKDYRKNIFGASRHRIPNAWYRGTTGVFPLDATIQWAMNYGYINHIQRLMIVSNYMTLDGFHPDALFKWMFEFSLDSYEWVMIFNCYSMGSWSDGGIAMRKPYISGATYIKTMSDAAGAEKNWESLWTDKYRNFMKNKADILKHTQAWRPQAAAEA
jgi:deoxyribodipyrimidine photolyase-related protein